MLNISFGGENDGKFLVRNMMWEVVKILCGLRKTLTIMEFKLFLIWWGKGW